MNLLGLLQHLPTATIVAVVISVVIPGLSSLLAKEHWPSELVGALTLLLSAADGFFSEWAKDGDGFAWKAAVGTALLSYVVALASRIGIFRGTDVDARLLAVGSNVVSLPVQTLPVRLDSPPESGPQPQHAAPPEDLVTVPPVPVTTAASTTTGPDQATAFRQAGQQP